MNRQVLKLVACVAVVSCIPIMSMAAAKKAPTVFFVQSAQTAVISAHQLQLNQPQPRISWFADAPSKANGHMPMTHYYDLLWGNAQAHFNQQHPNASLVGEEVDPVTHQMHTVNLIVNLTEAKVHGSQMTYQICNLMQQDSLTELEKPLVLQHPTLFIDRYICPTCD